MRPGTSTEFDVAAQSEWRRFLRLPLGIAVIALAIRLAVIGWMYGVAGGSAAQAQFTLPTEAAWVARSIATGRGFYSPLPSPTGPTAWEPPVYPYLLAGVFRVFGVFTSASAVAILALNSLFSALTCLPVFFLARRSFGPTVAVAAAWTWAVFPNALYVPVHFVWDTALATLLIAALALLAMHLEESPGVGPAAGFGLLWGLAALTNASLFTALPPVGGWLCWRWSRRGARWAGLAAAAALAFLLSVAPWFARNYRTFGRFVPFRSNFGLALWLGNGLETEVRERDWLRPYANLGERQRMERLGELAYMKEKREQAAEFIASHPGTFAWLTFKRVVFIWTGIWNLTPDYLLATPMGVVSIPFCTILTVLALAGLRQAFRLGKPIAWPCALLLLALPLVYYITLVSVRYRHPMDPFLVVLAAYAVVESRTRRSEIPRPPERTIP